MNKLNFLENKKQLSLYDLNGLKGLNQSQLNEIIYHFFTYFIISIIHINKDPELKYLLEAFKKNFIYNQLISSKEIANILDFFDDPTVSLMCGEIIKNINNVDISGYYTTLLKGLKSYLEKYSSLKPQEVDSYNKNCIKFMKCIKESKIDWQTLKNLTIKTLSNMIGSERLQQSNKRRLISILTTNFKCPEMEK